MLRGNLSTRPFYNERAVHLLLALVAGLTLGFTAFNVSRILALSNERTDVATLAAEAETQARQLRDAAASMRRSLDARQIDAVSASAREANAISDRRLFSWTELFNYFEAALPADVRLTSIRPRTEADGTAGIAITVVSRRVEDLDRFMTGLEETGAFWNVLSREERTTEQGDLLAALEARYRPSRTADAAGRTATGGGASDRPPAAEKDDAARDDEDVDAGEEDDEPEDDALP